MSKKEYWSVDDEDYEYESLSDLLDANPEIKSGDTVYVGEAKPPNPHHLVSAMDVVNIMSDRALDIADEHACDYPNVTDEAYEELDRFLHDWVTKNCSPNFFVIKNSQEYKVTIDDI
jgi:hypothetical protein